MDAGSAIVASVFSTLAFLLVVTALRRLGRRELDVVLGLGGRIVHDPSAAFVSGVIAVVAIGMVEALAFAAVWGLIWSTAGPAAWPIAPAGGAVMAGGGGPPPPPPPDGPPRRAFPRFP